MALNLFYILALCCTSLGFIMLITALSSASWMIACMNNDNISNQLLQGKPCLYQGIFKSSMKAGNIISVNIPVDITTMPRSIMFGALALIVGLLFALVGGIVILIAFRGDQATYEGKNKVAQRTRSGCIMLLTAGTFNYCGYVCIHWRFCPISSQSPPVYDEYVPRGQKRICRTTSVW
uniref:uncharacterized protein LOC120330200 n=1 Tax=Styela clava TaxID=7725 RepID=UPI00193A4FD4|nr:uncharacterized protein LOC120330200 [Styela clava]